MKASCGVELITASTGYRVLDQLEAVCQITSSLVQGFICTKRLGSTVLRLVVKDLEQSEGRVEYNIQVRSQNKADCICATQRASFMKNEQDGFVSNFS